MEKRFSSLLERAINQFIPGYFSWDEQAQDKSRLFMSADLKFKFHQFILKEAFDIEVADDDAFDDAIPQLFHVLKERHFLEHIGFFRVWQPRHGWQP